MPFSSCQGLSAMIRDFVVHSWGAADFTAASDEHVHVKCAALGPAGRQLCSGTGHVRDVGARPRRRPTLFKSARRGRLAAALHGSRLAAGLICRGQLRSRHGHSSDRRQTRPEDARPAPTPSPGGRTDRRPAAPSKTARSPGQTARYPPVSREDQSLARPCPP